MVVANFPRSPRLFDKATVAIPTRLWVLAAVSGTATYVRISEFLVEWLGCGPLNG